MLYSDIDTLLDVSVSNTLVDDDSDRGFSHVVNNPSFAVVDLVWHAFLNCAIDLDIHDVADPIDPQVCRQRNQTLLLKVARKGIPSAGSQAMRVTHLEGIVEVRW